VDGSVNSGFVVVWMLLPRAGMQGTQLFQLRISVTNTGGVFTCGTR